MALAQAFREATAGELSAAEAPAEYHRVAKRAQLRLDQLYSTVAEEGKVPIACRAGCSTCCHMKVETRAHDLLPLAAWIKEHFSAEQQAALMGRLEAYIARTEGQSVEQQLRINFPCPLLSAEGWCTAYEARPATCRVAHSIDVKPCLYAFEHPEDLDAPTGADKDMRLIMRVAHDAVAWAFQEGGHDMELYQLSAGLAEALKDPTAQERWQAGERAFSDAALSRGTPAAKE